MNGVLLEGRAHDGNPIPSSLNSNLLHLERIELEAPDWADWPPFPGFCSERLTWISLLPNI